jgi:hypothetical protein
MERCNGCEYEYDGICTATGEECNEIAVCTVITNRVKEEVLKEPPIEKEKTKMKKTKQNKQGNINPDYYKDRTSIECIDNMRLIFGNQRVTDYCIVNAYKYLSRYKYKNGYEDLCKAKWYLDEAEVLKLAMETDFDYEIFDKLVDLCSRYMEEYKHGKGNE